MKLHHPTSLSVPKVRYCGKDKPPIDRVPMTTTANPVSDQLNVLGERLRQRLEPGRGERPGRPSDPTWTVQRKLSMNEQTLELLGKAADAVSTHERRVSPMQIAALLIEDATQGLAEELNGN